MIEFYGGNLHHINYFLKIYAYAKTIGQCEGLDALTQTNLETAAIVHNISCPLCREHGLSVIMASQLSQTVSYVEWFRQSRGSAHLPHHAGSRPVRNALARFPAHVG